MSDKTQKMAIDKSSKTKIKKLLVFSTILIFSVSNIVTWRPMTVDAASIDTTETIIASNENNSYPIGFVGITQSFIVNASDNSPACDGQSARINSIKASIVIPTATPTTCGIIFPWLYAEVRDPNGDLLGVTKVTYNSALSSQDIMADFRMSPSPVIVKIGSVNTVRFYERLFTRARVVPGQPGSASNQLSTATSTPTWMCTAVRTLNLAHDTQDPYGNGNSSVNSSYDIVATINHTFITYQKILAIILDPIIETVTYTDEIGTLGAHNYGGKRLHEVIPGWEDPLDVLKDTAITLNQVSGGAIEIVVTPVIYDEWPQHMQGDVIWSKWVVGDTTPTPAVSPTPIIKIASFTKWNDNTYPLYPHIPEPRRAGIQRPERQTLPSLPSFDYQWMMGLEVEIHDNKMVSELLADGIYDEIWLLGEPTSGYGEGNNIIPPGGTPYNLNGDVATATSVSSNVPVMGYMYELPKEFALHSMAHRIENIFASVTGGNIKVTCSVNRTENSYYNKYLRIWSCHNDDRTSTPPPTIPSDYYGGIGAVHTSHNAPVSNPNDFNSPELNEYPEVATIHRRNSNADGWLNFPDIDDQDRIRPIISKEWLAEGYMVWWLNHLPRYSGVYSTFTPTATLVPGVTPSATPTGIRESENPSPYNNIWPYLIKPGCYKLPRPRNQNIP